MEKYIGTKVIKARPMTLGYYNERRGWDIPRNENPEEPGYLVGYPNTKGNFDGELEGGCHHISWSPADVFDATYKSMTSMSFGLAIEAMKIGCKVARAGWNGKGIFIGIQPGFNIEIEAKKSHDWWMEQKRLQGFKSRKAEDGEELMVPYAQLSENQKNMDRAYVTTGNEMTSDFIYIDTTGLITENPYAPKSRVPWLASQTDMLANDWNIVE